MRRALPLLAILVWVAPANAAPSVTIQASTTLGAATGDTPAVRWHFYTKVPGFLPSGMFYSSFFVGAFAIHGYYSVPPYPASHGCIRIPMWIAPSVFASNSYGEPVFIYH